MKNLSKYILVLVVAITILFDTNGKAIGVSIWPSAPSELIYFASVFGKVIWIVGVILIFSAVIIFILAENKSVIQQLIVAQLNEGANLNNIGRLTFRTYVHRTCMGVLSIVAILSGFTFTGTAMLLVSGAGVHFTSTIKKIKKEHFTIGEFKS